MTLKSLIIMILSFIFLFLAGTIVVIKLAPKMHPTMIIERLIIKTESHLQNNP